MNDTVNLHGATVSNLGSASGRAVMRRAKRATNAAVDTKRSARDSLAIVDSCITIRVIVQNHRACIGNDDLDISNDKLLFSSERPNLSGCAGSVPSPVKNQALVVPGARVFAVDRLAVRVHVISPKESPSIKMPGRFCQ